MGFQALAFDCGLVLECVGYLDETVRCRMTKVSCSASLGWVLSGKKSGQRCGSVAGTSKSSSGN